MKLAHFEIQNKKLFTFCKVNWLLSFHIDITNIIFAYDV